MRQKKTVIFCVYLIDFKFWTLQLTFTLEEPVWCSKAKDNYFISYRDFLLSIKTSNLTKIHYSQYSKIYFNFLNLKFSYLKKIFQLLNF